MFLGRNAADIVLIVEDRGSAMLDLEGGDVLLLGYGLGPDPMRSSPRCSTLPRLG
jgi:hypothetical protein